jgi:ABC-2 type transport system permease protein
MNRPGGLGYIAFITPGVMLLAALTAAALGGGALLLQRLNGTLKSYLVTPVARGALLGGLVSASLSKALGQALLVLLLGLLLGARLAGGGLALLGALLLLAAFTLGFGGLATAFAGRARGLEGYHALVMLLNLPVLFVSSALYPLESMPAVIRVLAYANPTTYATDAIRHLLFGAPLEIGLVADAVALLLFMAFGLLLGAGGFRRAVADAV